MNSISKRDGILLSLLVVVIGFVLSGYHTVLLELGQFGGITSWTEQPNVAINKKKEPKFSDAVCSSFLNSRNAKDIWLESLNQTLEWTVHPFDEERHFLTFGAKILQLLPPERLRRSLKTMPHRFWSSVKDIITIVKTRHEWLQQQRQNFESLNSTTTSTNNIDTENEKDNEPRRLQILVMGGSVAEGDTCNPRPRGIARQQRRRQCAWPFRLEATLYSIFGDVVELTVATLGGTNTESAINMLEYDLIPQPKHKYDVIFHAYATNDMHLYTLQSAQRFNLTLRDRILDLTEQFFRSVLTSCRDPPPLVIYLDDYLGNEQNDILETSVIAQTIPFLANYYGVMSISYADAVRDLVYGDTDETYFSPRWAIPRFGGIIEWTRQIHPGMGMHIATLYMILYDFLVVVTEYCTLTKGFGRAPDGTAMYVPMGGLPNLDGLEKAHYQEPKLPPEKALPPRLYPNLELYNVTEAWKRKSNEVPDCATAKNEERRCIFSWISRVTSNCMMETQLQGIMEQYMEENIGWAAKLDYKKLGFVALANETTTPKRPTFTLKFDNLTQPIRSIMLIIMKSYGEKWNNTQLRLTASSPTIPSIGLSVSEFQGFHDKNTSEQYTYTSHLQEPVMDSLRLGFNLVSGRTFKIMGMAVCH